MKIKFKRAGCTLTERGPGATTWRSPWKKLAPKVQQLAVWGSSLRRASWNLPEPAAEPGVKPKDALYKSRVFKKCLLEAT